MELDGTDPEMSVRLVTTNESLGNVSGVLAWWGMIELAEFTPSVFTDCAVTVGTVAKPCDGVDTVSEPRGLLALSPAKERLVPVAGA